MFKQINKSYFIRSIALSVVLTAIIVGGGVYWFLGERGIAVGKPCFYNGAQGVINTHGLQCYFYGTSPRHGVWIVPDLRYRVEGSYKDYFSDWKKYESPDKKITFEYPQTWFVNELNWKDMGSISIGMGKKSDIPPYINIEKVAKNAVTIADRIQDIKKTSSTVLEDRTSLNGSEVIRLYVAQTNNLQPETTYLFIDKGEYYVVVNAPKFNDPLFDFPTDYLLSTIDVHL